MGRATRDPTLPEARSQRAAPNAWDTAHRASSFEGIAATLRAPRIVHWSRGRPASGFGPFRPADCWRAKRLNQSGPLMGLLLHGRLALRKFRPIASAASWLAPIVRLSRAALHSLGDGHAALTSASAFLGVTLIGRPCGVRLRASGVSPIGHSPEASLVAASPAKTSQEYLP